MKCQFTDRVPLESVRRTSDGYLVGTAPVARTGIQIYDGAELGMPDRGAIRVYRSEDQVFADEAIRSYAYRPITVDHPSERVTSQNWRDLSAGMTGGDVMRDGQLVRVPMTLMDESAITEWEGGKRELSMGYDAEIEFTDGVSPEGERYDAIQKNMRMNHLALVARARGGDQLRLGDDNHGGKPKMNEGNANLRTVHLDGLPVETTDAGAQAIERLQTDLKAERQKVTDAEANHAKEIEAKDAELAKRDAKIDELGKKVLSDADLDKRVNDRADLIAKARAVHDADYSGKSDSEIRKMAVAGALGDEAVADKTEPYIEARFDILADDAGDSTNRPDPVRQAIQHSQPRSLMGAVSDSQKKYEDRLQNGWKQPGGEA